MNLLILPGVNSGPYLFEAAAAQLKGHKVVTLTPPGMGRGKQAVPLESSLTSPYSAGKYAAYALTWLKSNLPAGPLVIMGHSLGSYAAQELTRQLLKKPLPSHPLTGLILVSSGPGQPNTTQDVMLLQFRTGRTFWQYMKDIQANPEEEMKHLFGAWPSTHPQEYAAFIRTMVANPPISKHAAAAQLMAGSLFSSYRWAGSLKIPTLCLHGEDDRMVSLTSGRALHALLPGAELKTYPATGHFPMLEVAGFYEHIATFLRNLPNRPHTEETGKKHVQTWAEWATSLFK